MRTRSLPRSPNAFRRLNNALKASELEKFNAALYSEPEVLAAGRKEASKTAAIDEELALSKRDLQLLGPDSGALCRGRPPIQHSITPFSCRRLQGLRRSVRQEEERQEEQEG